MDKIHPNNIRTAFNKIPLGITPSHFIVEMAFLYPKGQTYRGKIMLIESITIAKSRLKEFLSRQNIEILTYIPSGVTVETDIGLLQGGENGVFWAHAEHEYFGATIQPLNVIEKNEETITVGVPATWSLDWEDVSPDISLNYF